jgi:hypothetical protein
MFRTRASQEPRSQIPIVSKQAELLADEAAHKAIELDDSLPEAHGSLRHSRMNGNGKTPRPNFAAPSPSTPIAPPLTIFMRLPV